MWPIYLLVAGGIFALGGVLVFVFDMLRHSFTGKTFLLRKDDGNS